MRRMSEAIGVKCDHCHVQGNFASDEKRPKHTGAAHAGAHARPQHGALPATHPGRGRVEARPRHLLHLPPGRGRRRRSRRGSGSATMSDAVRIHVALRRGRRARRAAAAPRSLGTDARRRNRRKPGIAESPTITVLKGLMVPQFEMEMRHFVQALGVNCGGCHAPRQLRQRGQPAQGHRPPDDRDDPGAERRSTSPPTRRPRARRRSAASPATPATRAAAQPAKAPRRRPRPGSPAPYLRVAR